MVGQEGGNERVEEKREPTKEKGGDDEAQDARGAPRSARLTHFLFGEEVRGGKNEGERFNIT